jgi:ribose transport system permease protein
MRGFLHRFQENQVLMALLMAAALYLVGGIFTVQFFSLGNIGSIISLTIILGLAGAGQTLVVSSGGGIDLSVGAVMSLGAIIAAQTMNAANQGTFLSVVLIIAMGIVVGLFNAVGVIITKVPSLVMTMATANVVAAVQWLYSGGFPTGTPGPIVKFIGTGRILPFLPYLTFVGVAMVLLIQFGLNRSVYGKQMFAVGNNLQAAYLSGVRAKLVQGAAFVLAGLLNAIAGFWFAAYNVYTAVGSCNIYVMPSIAALVIGGTSMNGGKGSYVGTMVGALVLTLLGSLLVLMQTDEAGRQIAYGLVLIAVLAAYNREPRIRL